MKDYQKLLDLLHQACIEEGKYRGRNFWRGHIKELTDEFGVGDIDKFFASNLRDQLVLRLGKEGIFPSDLPRAKQEEITEAINNNEDEDVILSNVQLQRKVQKLQDVNRIERKGWRHDSRMYNACEEFNNSLVEELKKINLTKIVKKHDVAPNSPVGVISLSDLHFNELVSLPHNKYDFNVASRRLKLLASRTKIIMRSMGIKQVLLAFCGDLLNSNRRVDELVSMSTNRAKACILASSLLEQFILDLNSEFNISIVSVSGNESRIDKDWGWSNILASDNFDFTIHNILRYIFKDTKGVSFLEGDPVEQIVDVNGTNILFTHGMQIGSDIEKSVQQLKGKYSSKGITVDYCIFGHVHSSRIGDTYARNSSLVGANAYSERGLNLDSRASQNIFIIHKDKNRDGFKIDLQIVEDVEGYDVVSELEAYDCKSADKLRTNHTILQIVI